MAYLGSWKIDDFITFYCNTHTAATGAATDADAVPTYRIYENETGAALANGNMAFLDAGNTVGFYSERHQLQAATGYEKGKQYVIYISATVAGIESTIHHTFQIEAEVDANNVAEIVDDVWDEVLTAATHNVGYSAGQRLRYLILSGAVAQAGGASTITLAATESATDDIYTQNIVSIVGGMGAGQTRLIIEYDGLTRLATVDRPWAIMPNATSIYELLPFSSMLLAAHGTAMAGAPATITFGPTALAIANSYVGSAIYITAGAGMGQTRLITEYTVARVATVSPAWDTQPDNTSIYKVIPTGRAIVESISAAADESIADAVWDELIPGHNVEDSFGNVVNDLTEETLGPYRFTAAALSQTPSAGAGAGAITYTYTLTSAADGLPIADADVWVTTDAAGANIVASGRTDAFGQVIFFLDAGTVYIWSQKSGWNFSNPDTEVVS